MNELPIHSFVVLFSFFYLDRLHSLFFLFCYLSPLVGQKRKSEGSEEESHIKQPCLTPPTGQEVVAYKSPKMYPISSHATGIHTPPLAQVAPVSNVGTHGMPVQTPIFIIYTGQQPQPLKNGSSSPNGKLVMQAPNGSIMQAPNGSIMQAPNGSIMQAPNGSIMQAPNGSIMQNGTPTIIQSPSMAQPMSILNGNGLPPNTQFIISPQVNGVVPSSQPLKVDLHSAPVHHPALVNGQTIIQAPAPTLVNFNGTPATLVQPNSQPGTMMMYSQPVIRASGGGNIHYATTNTPPQSAAPLIVTTASNSPRMVPPVPMSLPKKLPSVKQGKPICINHCSISESKRSPPPLVHVKQEVGIISDLDRMVHHRGTIAGTTTTTVSPTRERHHHHVLQQKTQHTIPQVSQTMTVLPHPLITEVTSSPLSTSPPASAHAIFKKPTGHTSLPFIILDEKHRESGRHFIIQPPQQQPQQLQLSSNSSGSSSIASFYGGNCLPVYRINSTLNNIQPLQIVSPVPAPPPGIALPDLMKRDTPTAH